MKCSKTTIIIRPDWKCLLESNTLAYSPMVYIKILKGLIRMGRGENKSDKLMSNSQIGKNGLDLLLLNVRLRPV
jgi:hypothetical protein